MPYEQKNCQRNLEKEILAPYTHLLQVTGKQFRNKIVSAFNHWFKVPEERVQSVIDIMATLHVGSLLLDDIQDNCMSRRGLPAAHCIYGVPLSINASIQAMAMSFHKAVQLSPGGESGYIYTKHLYEAAIGQGVDVYWRDNFLCPTEAEYKKMVEQKTGNVLLIGVKLMQLFSENKQNYDDFGRLLGYYLQLRDDYCNLKHQDALEEWPGEEDFKELNFQGIKENNFCEDLTEGKFSLPIIHSMRTSEGPKVLSILRQRTRDVNLKKYCLSLLEKSGSLQYTRDLLSELDREARQELLRLGGNPLMDDVLDGLLSWKNAKTIS